MNLTYKISTLFPAVEQITIKVLEYYSWDENRLKDLSYSSDDETDFFFECPMSKCIGNKHGVYYRQTIIDMISRREEYKQVKLNCEGYGGYNHTFHCDWYVSLGITIQYKN